MEKVGFEVAEGFDDEGTCDGEEVGFIVGVNVVGCWVGIDEVGPWEGLQDGAIDGVDDVGSAVGTKLGSVDG